MYAAEWEQNWMNQTRRRNERECGKEKEGIDVCLLSHPIKHTSTCLNGTILPIRVVNENVSGFVLSGRVHTSCDTQRYMLYTLCVSVFASINVCWTYTQSNHGNLNETLYLVNKTFYLFYTHTHSQPQSSAMFIPLNAYAFFWLFINPSVTDFLCRFCVCPWVIVCVSLPFRIFIHFC